MKNIRTQRNRRDSNDPLVEKVRKAAKRASRVPSNPSDSESSHINSGGKASRVSQRPTILSRAPGVIRLRVDPSLPLNLDFIDDMDGDANTESGIKPNLISLKRPGSPSLAPAPRNRGPSLHLLGSKSVGTPAESRPGGLAHRRPHYDHSQGAPPVPKVTIYDTPWVDSESIPNARTDQNIPQPISHVRAGRVRAQQSGAGPNAHALSHLQPQQAAQMYQQNHQSMNKDSPPPT